MTYKSNFFRLLLAVVCAATLSCKKTEIKLTDSASSTYTFSPQVKAIVTGICINCHRGGNAPDGFNFVSDAGSLVSHGLIVPGSPDNSVLYQKLSSAPPFGEQMPLGGPYMSATQLQAWYDWI